MKPVEIVLTSLSCFNDISIVDSATFSCSRLQIEAEGTHV